MDAHAHPPRPRLAIRVGVTGHRIAPKLPDAAVAAVEAAVGGVLDTIAEAAGAVRAAHPDAFAAEPPLLAVVSSLAEGADQIVAAAGLSRGYVLDAILPLPAAEYAGDFVAAETHARFATLIEAARARFVLDGTRERVNRAYQAAGILMLANADVLVAVWDEADAAGQGGTAEIVGRAVADGMPVVIVGPQHPGAAHVVWTGLETMPPAAVRVEDLARHPLSMLAGVVDRLLAPPVAEDAPRPTRWKRIAMVLRTLLPRSHGAHAAPSEGNPQHEPWLSVPTFLSEREESRRKTLQLVYPRLQRRFAGRTLAPGDFRARPYVDETASDWAPFLAACPADPTMRGALERSLLPAFAFADKLGVHYSLLYRGAFVASFLLAATAVMLALLAVLPVLGESAVVKVVLVVVELAIIALILIVFVHGSSGRWHRKWLAYRRLAEVLRPMRLTSLVAAQGIAGRPAERAADTEPVVGWYARAVRRTLPLPTGTADAGYLAAVRRAAIDGPHSEIGGQIGYNDGAAARMLTMERLLHARGEFLFAATFWIGLAFLAFAAALMLLHEEGLASLEGHDWPHAVKLVVTFLMALLPTVGAALSAVRVQGDFAAVSERSRETEAELSRIVLRMREEPDASVALLTDRIERAVDTMQSDLAAWHALSRARPLALPA